MTGRSGLGRALWVFGFLIVVLAIGLAYPLFARGQELGVARYEGRWYLLALLLVPALLWRGTWGEDRRIPRIRIGTLTGLARGPSGFRVWIRDLPGVIRSVAFGLLVLALARPVNTLRAETTDQEGIDMVVVLDMSGSMQAAMANVPEDLKRYIPEPPPGVRPTRLDAAKGVIRDFIARRKSDRIGVVVFGKNAYVLSPPTLEAHRRGRHGDRRRRRCRRGATATQHRQEQGHHLAHRRRQQRRQDRPGIRRAPRQEHRREDLQRADRAG
jgi:Ca-activated chloride channel family protein